MIENVWDLERVVGEKNETGVRVHQDKQGNIHGCPVDPEQYLKWGIPIWLWHQ